MSNRVRLERPRAKPGRGADPPRLVTGDGETTQSSADAHAEQAALGAMMLDATKVEVVCARIGAGDYWQPQHGAIHTAIVKVHEQGVTPDPLTVYETLRAAGDLRLVHDGAAYLHTCITAVPTTANAGHYAALVAEASGRRRLRELGARLSHAADIDETDQRTTLVESLVASLSELSLLARTATPTADQVDTWLPLDLEAALSGGVITPPPVLLERVDGVCLLYLGRLHSLAGEPESGKTWIALIAVLQALAVGLHVIYLDFEDTPEGIVSRLLALGAHPDAIRAQLHYIRPDRPTDDAARAHLAHLIAEHPTAVCVIDGVTEAMTLHGLDPYNNPDAARFYETLPRAVIHLPSAPAVLMIDHVPKDEDRPKRYAIGAQHKLAGLDGAAYVVDIVKPFAPGAPGITRMRVAKDRPGQVRRHARGGVIAELHIGGEDPVVVAELRAPLTSAVADTPDRHWRPTMLMERVSKWLEINPGASQHGAEKAVRGRAANVRAALEALIIEKHVRREPGENGGHKYFVKEPFREHEPINLEDDEL